jgi:DNA-binding beta-propeller fold protein YncE
VFAGLPSDASAISEFDVADNPGALAVSDDGSVVLAAASESGATALYSYDASGSSRRLLTATQIASIEFLNNSHDAVFADSAQNKVFLLRDASDVSLLADVDQPTALAASRDNRKIFVASSASRSLTTISIADGTSVSTSLDCRAATSFA